MISVCIATYNGEKYIKEQLDSILMQIGQNDEIIISDDGSKDDTLGIIEKIADPRVKVFINQGIHGFTHNFENALNNANGDYIFLSDQDDIWMNNKVEIVMKELKKVDFVVHDCITVNSNFDIISGSRFSDFNVKGGFIRHLLKSRFLGCCMAFRRDVLLASLPFPKRDDLVEHDIWIAALSFKYFTYSLIAVPLIYYRRHGNNASGGGFSKGYSMFNKIYRRCYRLFHIYKIKKKVK